MADRVPLVDMLCRDEATARASLEAAGCIIEPSLTMSVEHPMLGTIHRVFGVVDNLARGDDQTDEVPAHYAPSSGHAHYQQISAVEIPQLVEKNGLRFVERILAMLDAPDNDRVGGKLRRGELKYLPSNKRIALSAQKTLGLGGAHLPWGLQPLNLDLAMKVQRQCKGYGFVVFYSQEATLPVGSPPVVLLKRVFSTPFGVAGFGTWQEPISGEILDQDVGLLLEANWLTPTV